MIGNIAVLDFFLTSALLMFWLLPATALMMLNGRPDHSNRLWFGGSFVYAIAATLYLLSTKLASQWLEPFIVALSVLSVLLLQETLRRERGLPAYALHWLWLYSALWGAFQAWLIGWDEANVEIRRSMHLLLMARLDAGILLHALRLRVDKRSQALWMIICIFAGFTVINLLRAGDLALGGELKPLLAFTWLSSAALMLNYLSAIFYCFGYWGYVLEKEMHARQVAAQYLLKAQKNEIEQSTRAATAEKIQNEREIMYQHLLKISRSAQSSALSATVAHELSQPLAVTRLDIETAIAGLRKHSDPADLILLLESANASNLHAGKIIARMKNLFERVPPEPIFSPLDDLVKDCLSLMRRNPKLDLVELSIQQAAPKPIMANQGEIEHLFLNLLSNAIDGAANTKEAWVEIKTDQTADMTRLIIRNSGTSLREVSDEQLFELFRSDKSNGMGVGLWLSHHIAKRNNAQLRLDRSDLDATSFELRIPAMVC